MFQHPPTPHIRKHGPTGYDDYHSFKDWLRDEFSFRCVYCLAREAWYPNGSDAFGVEHVLPKEDPRYAHLTCSYDNLVYACNWCNARRGSALLLDPCLDGLGRHVLFLPDGQVQGLTANGYVLIRTLRLDHPRQQDMRRQFSLFLKLREQIPDDPVVEQLCRKYFGFPADLPNLREKRVPKNTRPDGIQVSAWQLREDEELAALY